jgi:hypothetical protein
MSPKDRDISLSVRATKSISRTDILIFVRSLPEEEAEERSELQSGRRRVTGNT